MNLSSTLEPKIERARAWLATVHDHGAYRSWVESEPPKPVDPPDPGAAAAEGAVPGEPPPFTLAATGAAAHLHAWLFSVYSSDADRRACRLACDCIGDWLRSGVLTQQFFDLGIGARGAYAASKALQRPEYWDLSIMLGAGMRGCDTSDGAHNRKAATIFKLLKRIADYDDLDFSYLTVPALPLAAKNGDRDAFADSLYSLICSCEALLMGDASIDRGRAEYEDLRVRIQKSDVLRGDVLAQFIRWTVAQGNSLAMSDLDRLYDFQHASGGFYERLGRKGPAEGAKLSTFATIAAIQAMSMAQNPDRARMPGPLTRKELALI